MKVSIYNNIGKEEGQIELPVDVFNAEYNKSLVLQVLHGLASNFRSGTAHTKTRQDVQGGGKKPWKQKGLGRARHGSSRSPIWKGGGTTFGPSSLKDYTKKLNKKMRTKALYCVLTRKMSDADLVFVNDMCMEQAPKTKQAVTFLSCINDKFKNNGKTLVVTLDNHIGIKKSFANIPKVNLITVDKLNAYSVMLHTRLLLVGEPKVMCEHLSSRMENQNK